MCITYTARENSELGSDEPELVLIVFQNWLDGLKCTLALEKTLSLSDIQPDILSQSFAMATFDRVDTPHMEESPMIGTSLCRSSVLPSKSALEATLDRQHHLDALYLPSVIAKIWGVALTQLDKVSTVGRTRNAGF